MKRLSNMGFVCGLLLLAVLFAACGGGDTNSSATNTGPIDTSTPATILSTPLPSITATGNFREYPLPQSDSGMMRPAIDHEGRIWFGEMNQNYLAVFDPRTQHFQQMVPPRGRGGIMGILVALAVTQFLHQFGGCVTQVQRNGQRAVLLDVCESGQHRFV